MLPTRVWIECKRIGGGLSGRKEIGSARLESEVERRQSGVIWRGQTFP